MVFICIEKKSLVLITIVLSISYSNEITLSKHPKIVIFSFDGFRYDFIDSFSLPNLRNLRTNGVSSKYLIPQFPTWTYTNQMSLATGLRVESHGIIHNRLYDPLYKKILRGYVNHPEFWHYNDDVVPLWIYNEWGGDGRISGVSFPGAVTKYGKNMSLPTHILPIDNEITFKTRMDFVINWLTNETHSANLVFMYFDNPDTTGHNYGPNSKQVGEKLIELDNATGCFIEKLKEQGIKNEINLIFTSDHGLEEVDIKTNLIRLSLLENTSERFLAVGDGPFFHIWPKNNEETANIYNEFRNASHGNNFSVYYKNETPAEWLYKNNRRIGPIVIMAEPGYVFYTEQIKSHFDESGSSIIGVHGYDLKSINMLSFFLANGPIFKSRFEIEPFENIDLFPLICDILGLGSIPSNGTIGKVADILEKNEI